MSFKYIYLDNHSTTPMDDEVLTSMIPYFSKHYGNYSSNEHIFGWEAKDAVEKARKSIASCINCCSDEIVFTSGATESNNLAIKGLLKAHANNTIHVITTNVEHKCVLEVLKNAPRNVEVTFLSVDSKGHVSLDDFIRSLRDNTAFVSIMFANNEIGSVNPISEIGNICRVRGILFHTDAAQALGKISINVEELNIDVLSASAHKLYGPKGVGFLYVRRDFKNKLRPLFEGGGQENGLRSGTLNVPSIIGMGKAIEKAYTDFEKNFWNYLILRNRLFEGLNTDISKISINGPELEHPDFLQSKFKSAKEASTNIKRLPNNLNVCFKGIQAPELIKALRNIAVSSGAACSSERQEPSYVLKAINLCEDNIFSSVRFGIGKFNTVEEIDETISKIYSIVSKKKQYVY